MNSLLQTDTKHKLIKPIQNRKVFHLLNDKDALLGQQGDVLLFLNDSERLIIKISSLKFVFRDGSFLHLVSPRTHWVVVFNKNCNDLIFHPALASKIENIEKFLLDHE